MGEHDALHSSGERAPCQLVRGWWRRAAVLRQQMPCNPTAPGVMASRAGESGHASTPSQPGSTFGWPVVPLV